MPCHPVEGFLARLRGLIAHAPPAPGTGWWFARCQSVHTLGMRYPIDDIFLTADGSIQRVVPSLPPSKACWQRGASQVVEMAAGEARRLGLLRGDRLLLQRRVGGADMARRKARQPGSEASKVGPCTQVAAGGKTQQEPTQKTATRSRR